MLDLMLDAGNRLPETCGACQAANPRGACLLKEAWEC